MRIAIICSNYFNIRRDTANGTAIFGYSFISELAKRASDKSISVTTFASGDSELPVEVRSIDREPSSANEHLIASGKNVLYEQTLLSLAFSQQDEFDVYHVNIGDGDIALPFSRFVGKPIVVTIHNILDTDYMRRFFSFYRDVPNVFFVSASNAQRNLLPGLNYISTIYHGVDPELFQFDGRGGESLMWAGRAIPEKGLDQVLHVAKTTGRGAKLFGIHKKQHEAWLKKNVLDVMASDRDLRVTFETGRTREELIKHFQSSKAFLLPVAAEESFGLVFIESMSCGTPVVAYARGSVQEVVEDGQTGFIVNSSDADIRGDWTVKRTGVAGLLEAVERIYAMPPAEYARMRRACRERVTSRFTIRRMVDEYLTVFKSAIERGA